ncbi:MAG: VOC family protein [Proteobacteria bacterium]|nr:VOC family protein [Pseudomonadota bacterium]
MSAMRLGHYSIRTSDLEGCRRFYVEVMGLRVGYRPSFAFPGLWLYPGEDESDFGVVHIIAEHPGADEYLSRRDANPGGGTGPLDHIAFLARGWPDLRARCLKNGVAYVERTVPDLGLHQVFLSDPSGVTIEMNYPAEEADG